MAGPETPTPGSPHAGGPASPARSKPVIVIVDDEPAVLGAVETDLRKHFRDTYRIVKAGSGAEALEVVRKLKQRGGSVALFLVDQRMPGMGGTEFLAEARQLFPEARKVLLTAYADTEAAIASINKVGLDHYLMKPWDPPEQHLYPVLDDLLASWASTAQVPYDGIRVVGSQWSARSHEVKEFLARNRVPYRWLDLDREPEARALVAAQPEDRRAIPLVFCPDGTVMQAPGKQELAERVGLRTQATRPFYDFISIGAGPAGLASAVYAASEGLRAMIIEKEAPGGQAGTSSRIENYMGFPNGLSGSDLAHRAVTQARRFGAEILTQEVVKIRVEDPYKFVTLADGTELSCYALLVATGVSVRRLEVPGADRLTGAGVFYGAALTEAAQYRGQDILVVGGANSAGQGAVFFARYARKVTMLVRGSSLEQSMSQYLIDQIKETPNIEVLLHTRVVEVTGSDRLESVVVSKVEGGESRAIPAAAVFVFIGAAPCTEITAGLLERDPGGFILTGLDLVRDGHGPKGWPPGRLPALLETSVPGIFAAGDVRSGSSKRVAASVGEGGVAVQLVHQYLKTV